MPRIFNRFTQEDSSSTRAHGGLGLGLAIVRHLVDAHGGTVTAESPGPGRAPTFVVMLPLMTERREPAPGPEVPSTDVPEPEESPSASVRLADVRILVVDDDSSTRDALTEMLAQTGATVKTAESAAEGMRVFNDFRPGVLLCDVAMPVEDGYSFISKVRALDAARGGNTPAVALTALAGESDRRRALAAGFQLHMAKPVDVDRLARALKTLSMSAKAVQVPARRREHPPEHERCRAQVLRRSHGAARACRGLCARLAVKRIGRRIRRRTRSCIRSRSMNVRYE